MIVSSYLVRMEPFTQHFLRLQGGHFDLADRMFHSMKEAWHSASRNNMADVKELIPEFFYLPEFFGNSNKFDLGCKQSGKQLDDVVLPPWAKGDAREFIRLHRMALECDFVSAHLHEWIDLIFGYKQLGQPAVEAINVFHHLFYEGNVDIYNIEDPLKKNATIGFINNFGQIPKQLFRKPHPCKKLSGQRTSIIDAGPLSQAPTVTPIEKVFYQNLDNLRPSMHAIKEVKGAVGQIIAQDKIILAVEQNKTLIPATYQRFLAWGFADQSLRIGGYESERAVLVSETPQNGEILAAVCPNNKTIITAGTSTVINVYEVIKRQLVQKKTLYGHCDGITCLAACSAYGLLVSGSRDRSAIIWDLARLAYVRQLAPHQAPVAALAINEQTGDIATCAGTWLHVWSINGAAVATVNTALGAHSPQQQILCVAFSTMYEWDPNNVIMTGSSDGVVRVSQRDESG
ncbi:WD repeat and FYVE domain-containing protein 3 [Chionoecetes opilio]|uniref:WD repeat and FYVE domain-containing protein 3 n=1 Tax=Chionoecetes opilio TaxID=41210 RepID=A0A8J4XRA2_CHIOP|nr:WD repeat and FYVE domain-containing protein 3 [Chionoecetes opilio]